MSTRDDLIIEAEAFDRRIRERIDAGFVPDIRRAKKCDYFYKSFWRDPHFIDLYLGEIIRRTIGMIRKHAGSSLSILDVGCGAGYVSLELARAGYKVKGIDISGEAIAVAKETLATNPYTDGFGSLEYCVSSLEEASDVCDVILFGGVLHHIPDIENAINKSLTLLPDNGLLVTHEPCHEEWRLEDAAQVAFIRLLLSLVGSWYEEYEPENLTPVGFEEFAQEIRREYVEERDRNEPPQSPNDKACSGVRILSILRESFSEIDYQPTVSFIYRMLGGLRGQDHTVKSIATLLSTFDRFGVESGLLRPNGFFFVGRKTQ